MTPISKPAVDFIFFDAGGGHRAAATALQGAVEQMKLPWNVSLLNLQEVLENIDIFKKYTGVRAQDIYNHMLRRGWTYGSPQMLPIMHGLIRLYHREQVKYLRRFYKGRRPRLVVSLIPNFNRALFQALRAEHPGVPYVTILTDLADYPPHFWMEKQAQSFICGTPRAYQQALKLGIPQQNVALVSGMILRPKFYDPITADRREERRKLGLDPDLPTGILLFGGHGSVTMQRIIKRIETEVTRPVQLIALCGKNQRLVMRLKSKAWSIPLHAEGFTQEVPYFMNLADFFIGKPGPGSISEALAMDLPVIVERNWRTMPQERYNTKWVAENGYGMVLKSFSKVAEAVEELLEPGTFEAYRARVAAYENRAVFEIPLLLDRLMKGLPIAGRAAASVGA